MTRYYHLDADSLQEFKSGDKWYLSGDVVSQYDDDDSENIEFSIRSEDILDLAQFLCEFIERRKIR